MSRDERGLHAQGVSTILVRAYGEHPNPRRGGAASCTYSALVSLSLSFSFRRVSTRSDMCSQKKCDDTSPSCAKWVSQGLCDSKARTVMKACPTSCGACTVRCADRHTECSAWAAQGECVEHADFMMEVSCSALTFFSSLPILGYSSLAVARVRGT